VSKTFVFIALVIALTMGAVLSFAATAG